MFEENSSLPKYRTTSYNNIILRLRDVVIMYERRFYFAIIYFWNVFNDNTSSSLITQIEMKKTWLYFVDLLPQIPNDILLYF